MEHAAEDYYDMPIELLPSANFAGRPMSDISMLDGLWTMIVSSSSEEDGVDEEELQIPSRPSQTQESPKTHKVTIVPPIGDNVDMDRPRLRKKAQTAPPGGFDTTTTTIAAPPKPRRAISTRLGYSNTVKRRQPKPYSEIKGSLTARSIEIDMKLGPQKPLPALPAYDEEAISPRTTRPPGSFSSKARVQETLKRKQLGTLDTALADYDFRRVPTSPGSMLATPRELYAIPEQVVTSNSLDSPHAARVWRNSARSLSPRTGSMCAESTRSNVRVADTLKQKHNTREVDAAGQGRIYLPGTITLAQHPAKLRRDSVATLDPFAFDAKLESPGRRMSELVGLDGIAMFFDEFGVVAEVTEMTLDKYWLREGCGPTDDIVEDVAADARNSIVSNIEQTGPKGQNVACSDRGSKFSFSSASSAASVPPPEKRKRSRLRDLLSPGLPGSAFLKAPASWGQQTENA
ncbi:hypothetical protein PTMSG1_01345 [Pyrenophora teres f. maculata]|nr:hypothetical protein PTMSG1_01345 [Pyrenophora teres f. maculata]